MRDAGYTGAGPASDMPPPAKVPSSFAAGQDELREILARWLWDSQPGAMPWPEISKSTREFWRVRADEGLAGPLKPLIEAQAAAERVRALLELSEQHRVMVTTDTLRRALDDQPPDPEPAA